MPIPALVAAALAVLALLWMGWRLRRWWLAARLGRVRRRGARGEARSRRILERHGYRIVAEQERIVGQLLVDGEPLRFELRADAIVEKGGQRLVAEIKTGGAAAPTSRETRRQLLEYAHVFRPDGVLLVDVGAERVYRIDFV